MEKYIDRRLAAIAAFIREDCVLADIGTDHGYLPVYCLLKGKIKYAYCCDVNEMPLRKAECLIKKNNLEKVAITVLSDGFSALNKDSCDDFVIAGMGFDSINKIIGNCEYIKNPKYHMIIQPMTGHENVRLFLYQNGFEIIDETAIIESTHCYSIMSVNYSGIVRNFNYCDIYLGKHIIKSKEGNLDSKKYITIIQNKLTKIKNGFLTSKSQKYKALEIQMIIDEIKKNNNEVLFP